MEFLILILIALILFWGAIGAVALFVLYKIIKLLTKYLKKYSSNPANYKSDDLMVMTFVAMAKLTPDYHNDIKLTAQIRDRVKSAFRDIDSFANTVFLMEKFDQISRRGNTIKVSHLQVGLKRFEKNSFHFKKEFMLGLLSIAYINGNLDENQENLLEQVKKIIGMTDSTYSKVMSIFWTRMRSGKYGDFMEFEKRRNEWYQREAREKNEEQNRHEDRQYDYSNSRSEERREYRQSSYTHLSAELEKAYSVLGLSPDASVDEIKKMKRELLKKYHPDLYTGKGERAVEEATLKSQEINQAFEMIMKIKN